MIFSDASKKCREKQAQVCGLEIATLRCCSGNKLEEVRLEMGSSVESQGDQTGKRRGWAGLFRSRTDGETVITEQTGSRGNWGDQEPHVGYR